MEFSSLPVAHSHRCFAHAILSASSSWSSKCFLVNRSNPEQPFLTPAFSMASIQPAQLDLSYWYFPITETLMPEMHTWLAPWQYKSYLNTSSVDFLWRSKQSSLSIVTRTQISSYITLPTFVQSIVHSLRLCLSFSTGFPCYDIS